MNLWISRNMEGYTSEPSQNDGIIINHIDEKDAKALEKILPEYGFEVIRKNFSNTDVVKSGRKVVASTDFGLFGMVESFEGDEPEIKVKESKPKKMWINKGSEMKKILPDELSSYTSKGWKVGRKSA